MKPGDLFAFACLWEAKSPLPVADLSRGHVALGKEITTKTVGDLAGIDLVVLPLGRRNSSQHQGMSNLHLLGMRKQVVVDPPGEDRRLYGYSERLSIGSGLQLQSPTLFLPAARCASQQKEDQLGAWQRALHKLLSHRREGCLVLRQKLIATDQEWCDDFAPSRCQGRHSERDASSTADLTGDRRTAAVKCEDALHDSQA